MGGNVSDDKGAHQPPKVMAVLGADEELDYACNGHEIRAAWDPRVAHQQTVLVTNRRLLLVGKPSMFGKVAPVAVDVGWRLCHDVSAEPDGGWIRIDLQTADGTLRICTTATDAYEIETRSRSHIVRARDDQPR